MADLQRAVSSVRAHSNHQSDSLLTAIESKSSKLQRQKASNFTIHTDTGASDGVKSNASPTATKPEDALHVLRSEPDTETLIAILRQLSSEQGFAVPFSLHVPGPLQAQIINTLVTIIVPVFWSSLRGTDSRELETCLCNVAGFSAVITRLKYLVSEITTRTRETSLSAIEDLLDLSGRLLRGEATLLRVWKGLYHSPSTCTKADLPWKEFSNLVGSGKIVTVTAMAEDATKTGPRPSSNSSWLSNGSSYAAWLGRNIATLTLSTSGAVSIAGGSKFAALLLAKGLNMGYIGPLLQAVVRPLLPVPGIDSTSDRHLQSLAYNLPSHVKRVFWEQLQRWLSGLTPSESNTPDLTQQTNFVSAIASLLATVLNADEAFSRYLCSSLSDPVSLSLMSISVRRACVPIVALHAPDGPQNTLERLISIFGDKLFINHAPIFQQEAVAQMLLLLAGSIHRNAPMVLRAHARSSAHMSCVSNRLDSSNARARWLGMVVGIAISSLVDAPGTSMDFGTDEVKTEEADWYLGLVASKDGVGTLASFSAFIDRRSAMAKSPRRSRPEQEAEKMPIVNGKPVFGPVRPPAQRNMQGDRLTEVFDDFSSEEEDLQPYAKPDSDPEDSDEDATLVRRDKPRAPVYIRDLMSMLRDDKNHDRFQLGVKSAAPLIRRKITFGAEVRDHAEELAALLCNLQDPFDIDDFDELRLQALIAVLQGNLKMMAPWFSRQAFLGEYSIAQRCTILSVLGLGGRELAGLSNEDELNQVPKNIDFPSKRLPPHLHAAYTPGSTKRLDSASKAIEHALIQPLALEAADRTTAHLDSVKVRTISRRMEIERTKRKPAPNNLAKCFGSAFFFPLANRYQQEIAAYGSASIYASSPIVLVTFLKTLALLLHASGPATMELPQVTAEFWDLVLSLRIRAVTDITILQTVLFCFLTLLEANMDKRRIAAEYPKQLMETQEWVNMILERAGGGGGGGAGLVSDEGSEDEVKVRTLAAGVLMQIGEVIEAYQKQLTGYTYN